MRGLDLPVALNENFNPITDDRAIHELGVVDWAPLITAPDLSWFCDFEFEPNSLALTLLEPFPLPYDQQDRSQLSPPDPSLPGSEIEKGWFTYINANLTSDPLQNNSSSPLTLGEGSDHYLLDEDFRMRACQRLSTNLNVDPLPSTGLLVSSRSILIGDTAAGLIL